VCISKIVVRPRLARTCLGMFAAAAWLISGMATLGGSVGGLFAQNKNAQGCCCALPARAGEEYCWLKWLQCGELGERKLKSGVLFHFQRRGKA
jgi:hypothetical protein